MSTRFDLTSDPATQTMLRRRWAGATRSFVEFPLEATERSIPERFEQVASLYPDRIAITSAEETLTYAALNERANRLARALLAKLGTGSEPVGLLLERSAALLAAILGTLKAGKLYVALDPAHPPERLKTMLADLQPRLVVTNERYLQLAHELSDALPADLPGIDRLSVDSLDALVTSENVGLAISPDTSAAIFYSSGSTGQPKGAVHSHRTMLQFTMRVTNTNWLCAEDRQPLFFSPGFSASMSPIFGTLLNGATLIVSDPRGAGGDALAEWIIRSEATVLFLIPSAFRQMVESLPNADEGRFAKVRLLIMGGEPISQQSVALWKQHFAPNSVLLCLLGSSEAGIISQVLFDKDVLLMEGHALAGYPDKEIVLVRDDGSLAPPGSVGEIVIKSRYLIPGYWRKPELSAAVFRPDPDAPDQRVFYSGDLGRFRADGSLEWMGRKDFQVKVRGYTVQIAEVETALLNTGMFKDAVVLVRPAIGDEQRLVAYLVAKDHPAATVSEVRNALKPYLPDYMIPPAMVYLEALPRTTNGKVDRKALPLPAPERPQMDELFIEPRNPVESQIAALWAGVLNVSPIGAHDDFFELGGNSLLALRMFAEIQRTLGRKLPLSALFEGGTVAKLAALIDAGDGSTAADTCLVPIQPRGARRPFFLAAGGLGGDAELLIYARLARHLGADQPFYGLRARTVKPGRGTNGEVEEIAAGHIVEVQTVQPAGPYLLGGECIGGVVAVEMARQLRERGQAVALLCLLDTDCPTWRIRLADRRNGLAQRMEQIARRTTYAIRSAVRAAGQRPPVPEGPPRAARLDNQYLQATRRYRPGRSNERITLLASRDEHHSDTTLGWQSLAGGGIEVHSLPGTHETYIRQNVQSTGECLRACLERAAAE